MDPATFGISAGLNEFGKTSYVGRGRYFGQLAPGRLMIEATSAYEPALYLAWDTSSHVITKGVEYYAKESRCDYKWVPSSNGEIVPNAIMFRSLSFTFYVGRTKSFNSVQVGKVSLEHHTMYYAYGSKAYSVKNYEVLVCNKKLEPTISTNVAPATPSTVTGAHANEEPETSPTTTEAPANEAPATPPTTTGAPSTKPVTIEAPQTEAKMRKVIQKLTEKLLICLETK